MALSEPASTAIGMQSCEIKVHLILSPAPSSFPHLPSSLWVAPSKLPESFRLCAIASPCLKHCCNSSIPQQAWLFWEPPLPAVRNGGVSEWKLCSHLNKMLLAWAASHSRFRQFLPVSRQTGTSRGPCWERPPQPGGCKKNAQ